MAFCIVLVFFLLGITRGTLLSALAAGKQEIRPIGLSEDVNHCSARKETHFRIITFYNVQKRMNRCAS